jgi:hypothetical protein
MDWGLALDNALTWTCGFGLEWFEMTDLLASDTDPFEWPYLAITPDQGSDGLSMVNAMKYGWAQKQYNVDVYYDPSHGGHNDLKLAIKDVGLWQHQIMMSICASAPYGPFGEGVRRSQLEKSSEEYFACQSPDSDPLFHQLLPHILFEQGQPHRITEPGANALRQQHVVCMHYASMCFRAPLLKHQAPSRCECFA